MKSNVIQLTDFKTGVSHRKKAGAKKVTRSAEENMWLIRLAEIDTKNPGITEVILLRVLSLKAETSGVEITKLVTDAMRALREYHEDGYCEAMEFINQTYDKLFPGIPARTSPEVYKQLEGL